MIIVNQSKTNPIFMYLGELIYAFLKQINLWQHAATSSWFNKSSSIYFFFQADGWGVAKDDRVFDQTETANKNIMSDEISE